MEGAEVIRGLRGWTSIPIIVLSGRAGSRDKVDALDAGADDYITKPFGVDELLARIRAVTRRTQNAETVPIVTIGPHTVDLAAHTITGGDTDVRLTPTEWQLLEHLLRHPGKLLSQRALLQDVWGPQYLTETNYLRQYMARLRSKLEADPSHPRYLLTEPGMGYRFQP
jgi:two-component system KDP operon response regulator KdpE